MLVNFLKAALSWSSVAFDLKRVFGALASMWYVDTLEADLVLIEYALGFCTKGCVMVEAGPMLSVAQAVSSSVGGEGLVAATMEMAGGEVGVLSLLPGPSSVPRFAQSPAEGTGLFLLLDTRRMDDDCHEGGIVDEGRLCAVWGVQGR